MRGIYLIRNKVNNKIYVGSAENVERRWRNHACKLNFNCHENSKLQNSWNKHGHCSFEFSLIDSTPSKETLLLIEQYWIDLLLADWSIAYNICPIAGSPLGRKHSQESKNRMAVLRTGKKHSAETREKIRQSHIGKKRSEEAKANMSKWQIGKKLSEDHKRKMREANAGRGKGVKKSEEAKMKMRGRIVSEETRRKMSVSQKRRFLNLAKSSVV